jgi:hypothetical protein
LVHIVSRPKALGVSFKYFFSSFIRLVVVLNKVSCTMYSFYVSV